MARLWIGELGREATTKYGAVGRESGAHARATLSARFNVCVPMAGNARTPRGINEAKRIR